MFSFFRGIGHNTSNPEEFDSGEVRRKWKLKTPPPHQALSSGDARRIIDQQENEDYASYTYVESISYQTTGSADYVYPNFSGRKRIDFDVKTDDEDSQKEVVSTCVGEKGFLSTATKWLSRNWLPLLSLSLALLSFAVYVFHNKQHNERDLATAIQQDTFVVRHWINEMRDSLPSPSEFIGSVIGRSKQVISKIGDHVSTVLNSAVQKILNTFRQLQTLLNPANNTSKEFKGIYSDTGKSFYNGSMPDCQSFSNDTCQLCGTFIEE